MPKSINDIKKDVQFYKKLSMDSIKPIPLIYENGIFKSRTFEDNDECNPPTPNISNKIKKKIKNKIENELTKIYKRKYILNEDGDINNITRILKDNLNENLIYFMVSASDFNESINKLLQLIKKEKIDLIYLKCVNLTSICCYYLLILKVI